MKKSLIKTPPQKLFQKNEQNLDFDTIPDVKNFILELRTNVLHITIDQFVYNMNWNNEKYYQQIVNGYKDKNGIKKTKQPTINYLFSGLNYAIKNFDHWSIKKPEIIELLYKYILKI